MSDYPATPTRPASTNTMSILSLVFAFLFWPLGIVFGHMARRQIRQTREDGWGLAKAGLILSYVWAALTVLMIVIFVGVVGSAAQDLDEMPGAPGGGDAAAGDVVVSQCEITDELGTNFAQATVEITNSTGEAQSYMATISVDDESGARVGEINAVSNSLAAGQSVTLSGPQTSGNVSQDAATGPAECTVANVDRFPSF